MNDRPKPDPESNKKSKVESAKVKSPEEQMITKEESKKRAINNRLKEIFNKVALNLPKKIV